MGARAMGSLEIHQEMEEPGRTLWIHHDSPLLGSLIRSKTMQSWVTHGHTKLSFLCCVGVGRLSPSVGLSGSGWTLRIRLSRT